MIGKICVSTFPYFDVKSRQMLFKNRPILVIGKSDASDYVVLPISRVTNRQYLNSYFDIDLDPLQVPKANLTYKSYVRTHKQTIINTKELTGVIVDFRAEYPDLYLEIIIKVQEFQENMIQKSIQ